MNVRHLKPLLKGIPGIPDFIESQRFGLDHATLFIERLGSDLDVFMQNSGGFLQIITVFTLGRELVRNLLCLLTIVV
jgi:hypothetical protein